MHRSGVKDGELLGSHRGTETQRRQLEGWERYGVRVRDAADSFFDGWCAEIDQQAD
jgi:hypothetical protein